MKITHGLIVGLTGLLAACSSQPADNSQTAAVANDMAAGNTVEEVMPSEGAASEEEAMTDADANAAIGNGMTNPADAAPNESAYLGRWVGVEGMVLNIAAKPGGGVTMDMRWGLDRDMVGKLDGSVTAEGLRFMRNGVAETAVMTDGKATGMKWLADKTTCLTVKPGEGYCRD